MGSSRLVWEQSGCQLEHGDGPEVLAGLRDVRAVITDPPYGCLTACDISLPRQSKTGHEGRLRRSAEWEVEGEDLDTLLSRLIAAADGAVVDGWLHVFCADRWLSALAEKANAEPILRPRLRYRLPFVFAKTNPPPRIRCEQWQSGVELAAVFSIGRPRFRGNWPNWFAGPFEHASGRWHECQKSLELLEHLVERYTEPGDLVVDPFAGSGQVIRACLKLRRRCVAVELDEEICETARLAFTEGLAAARARYAARGGITPRSGQPGQLALDV